MRTFADITSSDCARVISVNAAHLFGPLATTGPSTWRRTRTPSMFPTVAERVSKSAQGSFVSFPTHSTLATVPHPNTPCTDRENSSPDESCQASCAILAGFHWARRGAELLSEHVTRTPRCSSSRATTNDPATATNHLGEGHDVTSWLAEENVDVLGLGVGEHLFEVLLATYPRVLQTAETRAEKVG